MSIELRVAIDDASDALTAIYDAARSTTGITKEQNDALREKVSHLCDSVARDLMDREG